MRDVEEREEKENSVANPGFYQLVQTASKQNEEGDDDTALRGVRQVIANIHNRLRQSLVWSVGAKRK